MLVVQKSLDLEKEIAKKYGELQTAESTLRNTRRELDDNDELTEIERSQKQGEVTELTQKIKELAEATRAVGTEASRSCKLRVRSTGES